MTEPAATPAEGEPAAKPAETDVEKQAFLDRLTKESDKRKAAETKEADTAKQLADLTAKFDEATNAGLPELEREKKAREAAEKRAVDAEANAEKSAQAVALARAERWVLAAAKDFIDPDDAVRNINLADVEDADQAERAVKRVAKAKAHLLKGDEVPPLPGKVLNNGLPVPVDAKSQAAAAAAVAEASMLAEGLKQFATKE